MIPMSQCRSSQTRTSKTKLSLALNDFTFNMFTLLIFSKRSFTFRTLSHNRAFSFQKLSNFSSSNISTITRMCSFKALNTKSIIAKITTYTLISRFKFFSTSRTRYNYVFCSVFQNTKRVPFLRWKKLLNNHRVYFMLTD